MSQTTTVAPPRHALLQVTDDRGRTGSLHAARLVDGLWRTACGVDYIPGRVKALQVWQGEDAFAVLDAPGARHCSRCTRVGDAVEHPEAS